MAFYDDSPADEYQADGDQWWWGSSRPRRNTIEQCAQMAGVRVGGYATVSVDADLRCAGRTGMVTRWERLDGLNQAWVSFSDGTGSWVPFGRLDGSALAGAA